MFFLFYFAGVLILNSQNGITITKWISGVSVPVDITNCGDDRLFVVEKSGKIRIIENNTLSSVPFLDIISKVRSSGGEQGLLGLAFHPEYLKNGLFYVNYTDRNSPTNTIIEQYRVTANRNKADSLSGRVLLSFVQPYANHNGGGLAFGADGFLYIGTGDGGSANDPQNNSQNRKSFLGKMLRIDVDTTAAYKIPANNPFRMDNNYLPEIWSTGLRNPWRYSFDKETGDLWIGDVGQGNWEEIDFESAQSTGGLNYGWRCYEGNANFNLAGCNAKSTYTFPIHEYFSDENINGCSITGGYVYRGKKYPSLYGRYIYGDYCSGKIWALKRNSDGTYVNNLVYDHSNNVLTTFGQDASGELYFADVNMSSIYKIGDTCKLNFNVLTTDPVCAGASDGSATTSLNSGIMADFNWSNGDTSETAANLAPGQYTVTVIYNQCLTTKTFEIKGKQIEEACIQSPAKTEICASDSIQLVACDHPAPMKYHWYKDSIKFLETEEKTIWVNQSGNYQVLVTDSTGCSSKMSDNISITVNPLPQAPGLLIQKDTLIATGAYPMYHWYWNDQFIGSTDINKFIAVLEGRYRVLVVDSNQCKSQLSDTVIFLMVSANNLSLGKSIFELRPNPVSNQLTVVATEKLSIGVLNYSIYSAQSQEIIKGRISGFKDSANINVSGLLSGMYWIRLSYGKNESKLPFIKLHR